MTDWLKVLQTRVQKQPIVVIRLDEDEWRFLEHSRRGLSEFTIARRHNMLEKVKAPNVCLIHAKYERKEYLHFGLISSKSPITTLDTRIRIKRSSPIAPSTLSGLKNLIADGRLNSLLRERLKSRVQCVVLSPKLSKELIGRLAAISGNRGGMRAVTESLSAPEHYRGHLALQEDAARSALKAFGLGSADRASSLELFAGKETALVHVPIMEDSVIEHDARYVPGYDLIESDVTGRAVFQKGDQQLEVFTANRRKLEKVLGVDLIYVNKRRQNIVMVQYKMLLPHREKPDTDWIYRPDGQLETEIRRMKKFAKVSTAGKDEYRLNPAVFYLKFVKTDATLGSGGIILPLDHFEILCSDPAFKGPRGGLRVSYDSLGGRYMRSAAFLDLVRSGYIGTHAVLTDHLKTLIDEILNNNHAVIAAIESLSEDSMPVDDELTSGSLR